MLDGGNGSYTGEVQQNKYQVGIACQWGDTLVQHHQAQTGVLLGVVAKAVVVAKAIVATIQYADGRSHNLLGTYTSQQRYVQFPVKALWGEDGLDGFTHASDIALLLLLFAWQVLVMWEVAQCPYNDTGHQDNASHLLQVFLTFLPGMAPDGLWCWPAIRWQLHHKWCILALDNKR